MKFLTEYGFCGRGCCMAKLREDAAAGVGGGGSSARTGRKTSSLVSNRIVRLRRSKTEKHWQPTLSSISEDGLVPLAAKDSGGAHCRDQEVVVSGKKSPSSASSSGPRTIAKAHSFSYGDDEERYYMKPSRFMVIPAFSQLAATPVMF